jgi:type III secretion protein HrpB1
VNLSKPDHLNCSAEVVGGLIETFCAALMEAFPRPSANRDDAGLVLDALHVLRPNVPEVEALDGVLLLVSARWDDAIHILRQVVTRAPRFLYAKSLLAFGLAAKGDPDWLQCANEVLEAGEQGGDADKLVRGLIARHDMMLAARARRLGGKYVTPESVTALLASNGPQAEDKSVRHGSAAGADETTRHSSMQHDNPHPAGFLRA